MSSSGDYRMKERPILFSGPMVRAILEGRKTQTRRIIKEQPVSQGMMSFGEAWKWRNKGEEGWFSGVTADQISNPLYGLIRSLPCPHGKPGDRLWVREACALDGKSVFYREGHEESVSRGPRVDVRWRPSIHMPRWASRITLEITEVRVQRLQEISVEDAIAEGVEKRGEFPNITPWRNYRLQERDHSARNYSTPAASFMSLWDSINGFGSNKLNPWVWAITFKVMEER